MDRADYLRRLQFYKGTNLLPPPYFSPPPPGSGGGTDSLAPTPNSILTYDSWNTTAIADGAGKATAILASPNNAYFIIDRIFVESLTTPHSQPSVFVYSGLESDGNIRDYILACDTSGLAAMSDEAQPIYIPANSQVTVIFNGANASEQFQVTAQLRRPSTQ